MKPIQEIYERIIKIDWFSNCGKEMNDIGINYEQVKAWEMAVKKCKSTVWENIQIEAGNILTIALHDNWRDKYRMWNEITDQAKELLNAGVTPVITEFVNCHQLDIAVLHSIQWDILSAMMEHTYSPYVKPGFYTELLKVYEAGHFPCGWKRKWPGGTLLIY
ncbi:MAG TPA: hypothetical protein VHY08_22740 [Bacillota bacterium]|nr:hypothetical protein [Bacillota bacterium]